MKKFISIISVFALICIFGAVQSKAQTTEVNTKKDGLVKKTVFERKQAVSIQRTNQSDKDNTVVTEEKDKPVTNSTESVKTEKSTEVKKCTTTTTGTKTECQKKCTTPCHLKTTTDTEKKPVPKF